MKKFLSLMLALLLALFGLVACDGGDEADTEHIHIFSDASCKAPKTCSCGATEGEKLTEHTFENGVCSICDTELFDLLAAAYDELSQKSPVQDENGKAISFNITKSIDALNPQHEDDWAEFALTIDQESIQTGTYKWAIRELVYLSYGEDMGGYYDESVTIRGTLTAETFTANTVLNEKSVEPADYSKTSVYVKAASKEISSAINTSLREVLANCECDISLDDLGFKSFQ